MSSQFRGERFVRSVPGPDTPAHPLRLVAIDLYEDGLVARWQLAVSAGTLEREGPLLEAQVSDDCGTQFKHWTSFFGGTGSVRGETVFVPAVPPGASTLSLVAEGARFEVSLERAA